MDLETLRRIVENEIENYLYAASADTLGTPWTEETVCAELAAMKGALVSPYWSEVELRDTYEQIAASPALSRKCGVVANDLKGTFLVFDPVGERIHVGRQAQRPIVDHRSTRRCGRLLYGSISLTKGKFRDGSRPPMKTGLAQSRFVVPLWMA
jgi:hypothetical protein